MTNPQLDIEFYMANGLSFFPLPYGAKKDDKFKWGVYQTRHPSDDEIRTWFSNGAKRNIAVVCGQVSGGLVVLDSDTTDRFYELSIVICEKLGINDLLEFTRISQTSQGCHIWLFVNEPVQSYKFPKLDIQAEGKYVVAPPSRHPSGIDYKWANPHVAINRISSLLDIGVDLSQRKKEASPSGGENWIAEALKGVPEGERDHTCYRLASYFKNTQPIDITEKLLLDWNKKNVPPMEDSQVLKAIKSAYKRDTGDINKGVYTLPFSRGLASERDKSVTESVTEEAENRDIVTEPLKKRIEDWVRDTTGWFSYDDIDKDLGIKTPGDKDNRRQIIKRLKESSIIETHPKNNKLLRFINTSVRKINFKTAGKRTPLDIKFPFEIDQFLNVYSRNLIVVAGSPDAGKTAWLLNFIKQNQDIHTIFYQSSEMEKNELAARLLNFEGMELADWKFEAEERSGDFADVIRPDCINIVDYMELTTDVYLVAEYLKAIHEKLTTGIAIIALQKKRGVELGRGGEFSLEKPRLYLTMDKGKMTIAKAKNWKDPEFNPNDMVINYKIVGGCKFIINEDWHKPNGG